MKAFSYLLYVLFKLKAQKISSSVLYLSKLLRMISTLVVFIKFDYFCESMIRKTFQNNIKLHEYDIYTRVCFIG